MYGSKLIAILAVDAANEFSAERAHSVLGKLLKENKAHPIGSPQILYVNYYEDVDQKTAFYQLQSANPIPQELMNLMPFSASPKQLVPYNTANGWRPNNRD